MMGSCASQTLIRPGDDHKVTTHSKSVEDLFKALTLLKGQDEVARFLMDLCTPQEIKSFAERWEIARLLDAGQLSYREISEATKASTTTVARVARFLKQEDYNGYKIMLERLKDK